MKSLILILFLLLNIVLNVHAQVDRSGFTFGIGIGTGYSKHADSYSALKESFFRTIDEFSGFRIMAVDLKVGWGFTQRAQVYYTIKYSLPNTTISPYRSFYQGLVIANSSKSLEKLIYGIGVGINKAGNKEGKISQGTIGNIVLAYELNPHFLVEVNTLFGKMENDPYTDTYLNSANEFSFVITFNYLFYRKTSD